MNTAILAFDARSSKWTITYAGKILGSSRSKDYILNNFREKRFTKVNQFNVTKLQEVGKTEVNEESGIVEKVDKFGINERFDFLTDFVNMVSDRTSASLLVTGEGGLGKTFTVNKALKDAGLENTLDLVGFGTDSMVAESLSRKIFTVVKGYSTAKGLYRTLYENRNRIVVFDDCDSILKDAVALNLLKGALDSYDRRIISWNAESFGDDDLPRSFEFKGGVIFISNLPIFKVDQAIRSRAICVDLSMSTDQKIDRMGHIITTDEFLPEYDLEVKKSALEFLSKMKNEARELSLRTLIAVTKVAGRGDGWERRAEYLLTAV